MKYIKTYMQYVLFICSLFALNLLEAKKPITREFACFVLQYDGSDVVNPFKCCFKSGISNYINGIEHSQFFPVCDALNTYIKKDLFIVKDPKKKDIQGKMFDAYKLGNVNVAAFGSLLAMCKGGHTPNKKKQNVATDKIVDFSYLNFIKDLTSILKDGEEVEISIGNVKRINGSLYIDGSSESSAVTEKLKKTVQLQQLSCNRYHSQDIRKRKEYELPVFVDLSKLSIVREIMQKLYDGQVDKEQGEEEEPVDFGGFGDLF